MEQWKGFLAIGPKTEKNSFSPVPCYMCIYIFFLIIAYESALFKQQPGRQTGGDGLCF